MINILFYGNCQLEKVKDILNIQKTSDFNVLFIPCFLTSMTDIEFDSVLKKSDIIITQPITDNYRGMYYLSSNYIVNKCKKDSIIIFVNNCHFDFYYFDLEYNKNNKENKKLHYFHKGILECINQNYDFEHYKNMYIENIDLKTFNELKEIYDKSIKELENRYEEMKQYSKKNTYFINIIDFIKNNYKDKLLFYTFNHPSKHLLQYIALEIIKILNIKGDINYDIDPFSDERYILYHCIQNIVNFKVKEHTPLIDNKSSIKEIYQMTLLDILE
jgi:hypothetical protein